MMKVVLGDITKLEVDAIVNAANEGMLGGGGVDGAIHRAAGRELFEACLAVPEVRPGVRCPTGEARITPGFGLPARFVVHTVGPVWRGGGHGEAERLAACYRNSLELATANGCRSVAFPCISTGVYGYPAEEAADVAVREVAAFLGRAGAGAPDVTFCCFSAGDAERYRRRVIPTESEDKMDGTKKLGFGLMRLPKAGDAIDVEQTKRMVDLFLEAGFTYFDTAWAYPGSEEAIKKALVDRHPRESYTLATKNAAWLGCKTAEEAKAQLATSLERSGAGYVDYYLLHNLGESRTKVFDDYGLWDWAQEQKAAGLVRHVGFSFHSTAEELEAILRAHPEAEFVQLQINYADWDSPSIQSRRCWEVARAHGKPVVVMEPVKGGMLATPPPEVRELFRKADPEASAASWAIRFAADLDGVMAVLSGMSSVAQMEDNIAFMKDFRGLDEGQRRTLEAAREVLRRYPVVPCTSCDYCAKVCPQGIGISGSFTAMNCLTLYGNREMAASQEGWLVGMHGKKRAAECVGCGACEKVCPQHIAIREELRKVARAFGQ